MPHAFRLSALTLPVGFVAAALVATGALAQPVQHAPTGLAVTPPPGYAAQLDTNSGFTARIVVAALGDPNTACFVDFSVATDTVMKTLTQDQLNEMTRNVDQKAGMKGNFEADTLERMEHAGVAGAVLTGHFTKSPNLSSVLVIYYTPRGRTTVSCFSPPAAFKARQSEFMAVSRAITFPR